MVTIIIIIVWLVLSQFIAALIWGENADDEHKLGMWAAVYFFPIVLVYLVLAFVTRGLFRMAGRTPSDDSDNYIP